MDIKGFILKKIRDKGEVRSAEVVKATGFSRAYVNRFFRELEADGRIEAVGRANQARYVRRAPGIVSRAKKSIVRKQLRLANKSLNEDVVLDKLKAETGIWLGLPAKVSAILDYAFSEMLNNAIEHSRSSWISVVILRNERAVLFEVSDNGVGIFQTIKKKWRLSSDWEAIELLMKGKQTTKPAVHSGEGIFFTAKVADRLTIQSAKKKLIFDNVLNDIFVKDRPGFLPGTKVSFMILLRSQKNLPQVFRQYSDSSFEFSKTEVTVHFYQKGITYVSRSQGRRIVTGLEKFRTVIFDFRRVDAIGQAFADEVFRVWQRQHPRIQFTVKNANENVWFMIKRAQKRM